MSSFESVANCRKIPPSYEPRKGKGQVILQDSSPDTVTFFEKGVWRGVQTKDEIAFTNVFRWKLDSENGNLSLEHLRFGIERPVFLFTLTPIEEHLFKSLKPHECKEDAYYGSVLFDAHYIHLNWRIMGPMKNEMVSVVYS